MEGAWRVRRFWLADVLAAAEDGLAAGGSALAARLAAALPCVTAAAGADGVTLRGAGLAREFGAPGSPPDPALPGLLAGEGEALARAVAAAVRAAVERAR
jgi:hypothetical protein